MGKEILYDVAHELDMAVEDLVLEAYKGSNDQNKYGLSEEAYERAVRAEIEFNDTHGEPTRGIRLYIEKKVEKFRKNKNT